MSHHWDSFCYLKSSKFLFIYYEPMYVQKSMCYRVKFLPLAAFYSNWQHFTYRLLKVRSALPLLQPLAIARRSLDEWPKAGSDDIGEWLTPATPREKKDASNLRNGAEMRLDLCSVQRNAGPTELQVKREKFAFFDKNCSRVAIVEK